MLLGVTVRTYDVRIERGEGARRSVIEKLMHLKYILNIPMKGRTEICTGKVIQLVAPFLNKFCA